MRGLALSDGRVHHLGVSGPRGMALWRGISNGLDLVMLLGGIAGIAVIAAAIVLFLLELLGLVEASPVL